MMHSKKISILKDTAVYTLANYIVQVFGFVNSIALRRFMGPAAMGIWSILQVILGYCGYASFGTTKAMQRDYPYLRGRGEHERAEQLKDLTLTFSMIMSVIPAAFLLGYLTLRWQTLNPLLRAGLVFLTFFLFVQRFYDIVITLLRSDKKFTVLSCLMVLNALGGLLVTFLLVSQWNIYGLVAGTALVMAGCIFFIDKVHPYHFRFFWERRKLWKELKLGVPLVISAFLFEFLISMDKLIIAKRLGFYEVGLYSIAMMASQYIYSLPMMFTHVWYPNLVEEYGRVGDPAGIKKFLLTPVFILSVFVPFLCGIAIFTMPLLVQGLLPKFEGGLPVMKIYLIGTFFIMLAQFSNHFLVTLDKYLAPIPCLILCVGMNFFINLFMIDRGLGVTGVALGSAASFLFYGIIIYYLALRNVARPKEILHNLLSLLATLVFFSLAILVLERTVVLNSLWGEALVKIFLFALLASPFFWALQKRTKLITHLVAIVTRRTEAADALSSVEDGELSLASVGSQS
jgi:O-antigen/teichoic acid export membrane protein